MQCTRCLLDDSFPGIKFNKNNICSECISFDIAWRRQLNDPGYLTKTKLKLESILEKAKKNKKGKYDCAVITCGGTDSLYALYLIKTLHGLNPLVICIDNGLWNPQAKKNLDVVLNKLKIESIYYKLWNLKNLYRHFLIHTGNICIVCVYIIQFHIARIALKYKIRLIITGMSKREDAVLPFGATPINFIKVMRLYKDNDLSEVNQLKKIPLKFILNSSIFVRIINLPDYTEWDEMVNRDILEREFSIKLGKEHYDCKMHEFANYLAYKKYNFSYVTLKYCQKIRNRKISREKAKESVSQEEGIPPHNLNEIMDYFNVTSNDIETGISQSEILYSGFLNRIAQFARKIYFKKGI